ncbi:MAG: 4Fe-4S binding protein [Planctomycetes bacterium]|nr:4Fe-4S binding protein [Planctomycetota bacterium]
MVPPTPSDVPAAKAPCVPPGATTRQPRPSRVAKWRALVLILVHVAIVAHLLHWYATGETLSPLEPSEAQEIAKSSVINAGAIFFAASALLTLVFGRFFCGWGCHLVAVQDLCYWMLSKVGIRPKPMRARLLLVVPFLAFFYMFLWPAVQRWWLGVGFPPRRLELVTEGFWDTFPTWPVAIATMVIAGFSIIYFLGAKGFCTYACPYGALFGVLDKLAPGRIRVDDKCNGCGHCTQACTSDVLVHREVADFGMVVDQGCMKCLDCVSVCPEGALRFGFGRPAAFAPRRKGAGSWWKLARWTSNTWSEELVLAAAFVIAFLAFRGLYDSVHFLFTLGIAGIVSYLTLRFVRLAYRPRVTLQNWVLKDAGGVTGGGKLFAVGMLLLFGLQGHSAFVKHERAGLQAGYDALQAKMANWFDVSPALSESERATAEAALAHGERLRAVAPLALFARERWRVAMMSGWLKLVLDDRAGFEQELELAARVRPKEPAAHDTLARWYASQGDEAQADAWFRRAHVAAPEVAGTWLSHASWLHGRGREDEAREVLRAGAAAADDPAPLWLELGRLAYEAGDATEARTAYEAAVAADPHLAQARFLLGSLDYAEGRLADCARQYEAILAEHPEDARLHLQTSLVYLALEDWDRAEAHAVQARDLAPDAQEPWLALSRVAAARGDAAEAARLEAEAVQRAGAPAAQ